MTARTFRSLCCSSTAAKSSANVLERDGYVALQLGAGAKKAKNTNKAQRETFAKA